jgi:hypothetical protein
VLVRGWFFTLIFSNSSFVDLGYVYEARIYRKRLRNIISRMVEMQARGIDAIAILVEHEITPTSALSANRRLVCVCYIIIDYVFGSLFLEPRDQQNAPIPMELRNLIKEKVKSQDSVFRSHLLSINWTIEDELTVGLLYGDRPVETVSQMLQSIPSFDGESFSIFTNC